eukprot:5803316-Pyramimonas_sp.AAC.1
MSRLFPGPALPACIADAFYQIGPNAVQTSVGVVFATRALQRLGHGKAGPVDWFARRTATSLEALDEKQAYPQGGGNGSPPCCRPRLATICGSRLQSAELPAPLEAGYPAAASAACLPT